MPGSSSVEDVGQKSQEMHRSHRKDLRKDLTEGISLVFSR